MTTLIKVYENDYDFQYEQYFLVDMTQQEKEKLLKIYDEIEDLNYDERTKKYGSESKIDCIEKYIVENLKKIDFERLDIDTH